MQILLSRTQAGPGRTGKQEREEIPPNHAQRSNLMSVQRSAKVFVRGCEKLVPALAYSTCSAWLCLGPAYQDLHTFLPISVQFPRDVRVRTMYLDQTKDAAPVHLPIESTSNAISGSIARVIPVLGTFSIYSSVHEYVN